MQTRSPKNPVSLRALMAALKNRGRHRIGRPLSLFARAAAARRRQIGGDENDRDVVAVDIDAPLAVNDILFVAPSGVLLDIVKAPSTTPVGFESSVMLAGVTPVMKRRSSMAVARNMSRAPRTVHFQLAIPGDRDVVIADATQDEL